MAAMSPEVTPGRSRLLSVNVGLPEDQPWAGRLKRTAIRKAPVAGPVAVGLLGLEGDEVADTKHHGGTYKAIYAFAQEDYDYWTEQLGEVVPPVTFGENLTTVGIDVNEAVVGERWRVGTALLEVVDVRIPCHVFKAWMGRSGFDDRAWVRRFTARARPGPYLRVREEGVLRAGDPVVVEHRPEHGVTVSTLFRALTTERSLLPLLLEVDALAPWALEAAADYAASTRSQPLPS